MRWRACFKQPQFSVTWKYRERWRYPSHLMNKGKTVMTFINTLKTGVPGPSDASGDAELVSLSVAGNDAAFPTFFHAVRHERQVARMQPTSPNRAALALAAVAVMCGLTACGPDHIVTVAPESA